MNNPYLPKRTKLFGSSSKVKKGNAYGYRTQISYLPSGKVNCPNMSKGCFASCLGHSSGHMASPLLEGRKAQFRRQHYIDDILSQPNGLAILDNRYVDDLVKPREGWHTLAVRVNGTSDLIDRAERVARLAHKLGKTARFYDYTKNPIAALDWANGDKQVHITFSLSEDNWSIARFLLDKGVNVAAVCDSSATAIYLSKLLGAKGLVDGDEHDLRFLDPDQRGKGAGYLVALTPKGGKVTKDTTGFYVRYETVIALNNKDAA